MNERLQAVVLDVLVRLGVIKPIPVSSTERQRLAAERQRDVACHRNG